MSITLFVSDLSLLLTFLIQQIHYLLHAFYVDRVVHCRRCVPRAIPRIKGWIAELLKVREENEIKEDDFDLGQRMNWVVRKC